MKRWFSLMLVLVICSMMIMDDIAPTFAEEAMAGIESSVGEEDGDIVTVVDDEEAVPEDDLELTGEDEDPPSDDASDQTANPTDDVPDDAVEPELWYARTTVSVTLSIDDTVGRTIPADAILLVVGKAGEGLVRVACDGLSGVVDLTALEALTDEEYQSFMDQMTQLEEVNLYDDNLDFPLPPMPTEVIVEEPSPEPAETEAPADLPEEGVTGDEQIVEEQIPEATEKPVDQEAPSEGEAQPVEGNSTAEEGTEVEQGAPESEGASIDQTVEDEAPETTEQPEESGTDEAEQPADEKTPAVEEAQPSDEKTPVIEEAPVIEEPQPAEGEAQAQEGNTESSRNEDAEKTDEASSEVAEEEKPLEEPETTEEVPEEAEAEDPEAQDKFMAAGTPTAIKVNLTTVNLGLKESFSGLKATVVDANGTAVTDKAVTWRTGNAKIVTVDATGRLTGIKKGSAAIYASAEGLPEVSATVTVKKAPSKVILTPKALSLSVGMTQSLTPAVNSGAASAGFTYVSGNPVVATVDGSGRVTAVAPGTATITVSSFNGKKAKCTVTVTAAPVRIAPASAKINVAVGLTRTNVINAYSADNAAVSGSYTYSVDESSANPQCVKVDGGSGAVSGVSLGSAVIRVRSHNGLETTFAVEVVPSPADMKLSRESVSIGVKESYSAADLVSLVAPQGENACDTQLTWTSSKPKVAKVTADGVIKGVKKGSAVITVATHNGISKTLRVVVKKAPSKVTVKPKKLILSVGMNAQLTASVNKGSASGAFSYVSGNPGVAQVSASGVVTGVAAGTAMITVRSYNKKKASCVVTVAGEPASVSVDPSTLLVAEGMTSTITASAKDAAGNATPANYTFTAADSGTARVDGSGKVTGVKIGTTVVTVATHNGKTAVCNVEVVAAPADLTLSAQAISVGVKEKNSSVSYDLVPPAGQDKCATVITWKSANSKIAKVTAGGVIKGIKKGSTTVTATTSNGISKTVRVTVKAAPKSITVTPAAVTLSEGMKQQLTATANKGSACGTFTYTSSNPSVATVDSKGVVTGVSSGTATITVKSYNGKKAKVKVTVQGTPVQVILTESLTLAEGMTGALKFSALDLAGAECKASYSFTAVNGTGSVTVDGSGNVTATGVGTAQVKIATQNGVTTHLDASGNAVETVCNVTIVEAPAEIRMPDSIELTAGESYTLTPKMYTADGRETTVGNYTLTFTGSSITLTDGVIKAVNVGTSTVTATTYNGKTAACQVTVTRRYRVFAAYDYFNVSAKGSLTFPRNNANSFKTVMTASNIEGIKYENLGVLANPSKSELLKGISSAFSGSKDSDVSLVYLCSHGINYVDVASSSKSTHYGLQLPGYENYLSSSNYYITAEEIFNAIVAIKGQVILVLDSCYSGEFITNMKSSLDKQNGRISVMTAASNTRACYYNVTDTSSACDFFTYYLLLGAGYNMKDTHTFSGSMPADSNKDGKLTLTEMFNYAKSGITTNVPGFKSKSWFHGDPAQTPRCYKGNNGDLVLYAYAG